MSDPVTRLNAALEGRYKIERELGEGGMATGTTIHAPRVLVPWIAGLCVLLTSPVEGEAALQGVAPEIVGRVSFEVSCLDSVNQDFQAGVALLHSFAAEGAREAFRAVADADPACGMAWWGIAATHANLGWGQPFFEREAGWEAIARATQIGAGTERERLYVAAMRRLFEDENEPYGSRVEAYVSEVEDLYARYPDDTEAALAYALALIATIDPTDRANAIQLRAGAIAAEVFAAAPEHPGAAHYVIHAYDYPELAERALPAARAYSSSAPAIAHAHHMPTHIFSRLGLWEESIRSNEAVLATDPEPASGDVPHSLDYLIYAHLQRGDDESAASRYEEMLRHAETHQGYYIVDEHWADVVARYVLERRDAAAAQALTLPPRLEAEPRFAATVVAARAWGAARSGDPVSAREDAERLSNWAQQLDAAGQSYYADKVRVWERVVRAWAAHVDGDPDTALRRMGDAVRLSDRTVYIGNLESSADRLVQPSEEMGELLLELGRPEDALESYDRSLRRSPGRYNALLGAARAARRSGRPEEARQYYGALAEQTVPGSFRSSYEEARDYVSGRTN